ncbi:hypothetical protein HK098_003917 [Nowakowskiella sp. JEL0407]|nr:hypothetical protein HK098_003917 [Nowakowskiella sp. JEL0407]
MSQPIASNSSTDSEPLYQPTPLGRFGNPLSWTPAMTIAATALRQTLEVGKVSITRARLLTANAATPYPILSIAITLTKIRRRSDVKMDGLSEEDGTGVVGAEWVVSRSDVTDSDTEEKSLGGGSDGEEGLLNRITRTLTRRSDTVTKEVPIAIKPAPVKKIRIAATSERVILYIHGGAFTVCSPRTHRGLTSELVSLAKCKILAVDYRLSPENVFPAALHDCVSAYLYLVDPEKSIKEGEEAVKYDPKQVVIMGDSAGGNLTLSLMLYLRDNATRLGVGMPAGIAALSPWCDLTHSQPSFILNGDYDILPSPAIDPEYITATRSQYYISDDSWIKNPLVSPMFANIDDSAVIPFPEEGIKNSANPVSEVLSTVGVDKDYVLVNNEVVETKSEDVSATQPETSADTPLLLPPILIQSGSLERLYHEVLAFVSKSLRKSPGPVTLEVYEDMIHVHQMLQFEFLAHVAIERLAKFTVEVTSQTSGPVTVTPPDEDGFKPVILTPEKYYTQTKPYFRRYTFLKNKRLPVNPKPSSLSELQGCEEIPLQDPSVILQEGKQIFQQLCDAGKIKTDEWVVRKISKAATFHGESRRFFSTLSFRKDDRKEVLQSRKTVQHYESSWGVGLYGKPDIVINKRTASLPSATGAPAKSSSVDDTKPYTKDVLAIDGVDEMDWTDRFVESIQSLWSDVRDAFKDNIFTGFNMNQQELSESEARAVEDSLKAYIGPGKPSSLL